MLFGHYDYIQNPNDIPIGSHIVTTRGLYTHHGIYIGNNKVIHYAGFAQGFKKDRIRKASLEDFKAEGKMFFYPYSRELRGEKYNASAIIERAYSRLNENQYNLLWNNCESFANWCTHDDIYSSQAAGLAERNVRNGRYASTGMDIRDFINTGKSVIDVVRKKF